jgi:tetratricopeptide (TPR) repeat protein
MTACACGSGLEHAACCALTGLAPVQWQIGSGPEASLRQGLTALEAGDHAAASAAALAVLIDAPLLPPALKLLGLARLREGQTAAAEALLGRVMQLAPQDEEAAFHLGLYWQQRQEYARAAACARQGLRAAPLHRGLHHLMGLVYCETRRPEAGEHHLRLALRATPQEPTLLAALAHALKLQGRMPESAALYEQALALAPESVDIVLGYVQLEELRHEVAHATELLRRAETLQPGHVSIPLAWVVLRKREGALEDALARARAEAVRADYPASLHVKRLYETGEILDKLGCGAEAFEAFEAANRLLREQCGRTYDAPAVEAYATQLMAVFDAPRAPLLPRAPAPTDGPRPVFILGFPRSGTTLLEQMLGGHPAIHPGDELSFIEDSGHSLPALMNAGLPWPACVPDLVLGEYQDLPALLRDRYLLRAARMGASLPAKPWFTDKMPLNELHLGLIRLLFPGSPVIRLVRHPLDVLVSCYCNDMSHGFNMASSLEGIAHMQRVAQRLIEHYQAVMPGPWHVLRYEDLVAAPEERLRETLAAIGLDWDARCLAFHSSSRHARTPSYTQINQPLYARSIGRYRPHLPRLQAVLPLLEPLIRQYGYTV